MIRDRKAVRNIIVGYIVLYAIVGFIITPDYGFSVDEKVQRMHAVIASHYLEDILNTNFDCIDQEYEQNYREYNQRFYGNSFQLIALSLECNLGLDTWKDIYLIRHYMVFILFLLSIIALYFLLRKLVNNYWIVLMGILLYTLHPRIFSHSHYNPKDLVLLASYTICLASLYAVYARRSYKWIALHAVLVALLITVRLLGVIMIPITIIMIIIKYRSDYKSFLSKSTLFLILSILTTIAIWPLLWEHPLDNFIWAFQNLSRFPWLKDLIYFGEAIPSVDAPWHYLFVWIGITTPILFLILCIAGVLYSLTDTIKNKLQTKFHTYVLMAGGGPVVAVLLFNSILYGDWRHLYFIYGAIVILVAVFFQYLYCSHRKIFKLICIAFGLQCMMTISWIANNHPFQFNYFNALAQNELGRWEQDYWGLSFKAAMEKIADDFVPSNETVIVASPDFSAYGGYQLLNKDQKDKITYSWVPEEADYFITNYRFLEEVDKMKSQDPLYDSLIYQFKVDDVPIMSIYKVPKEIQR